MTRILIFAKAPVPGRVKTRLIPALGPEGAASLARDMLDWTIGEALATGLPTELCGDPDAAQWHPQRPGLALTAQGAGDLGQRLARAAGRAVEKGAVLLIGGDCPELDRERLAGAGELLEEHDAVLHPAQDGGYVLLGLRRFDPSLFEAIDWSTAAVGAQTIARIRALGWTLAILETLRDVDRPEDLRHSGDGRNPVARSDSRSPLQRE